MMATLAELRRERRAATYGPIHEFVKAFGDSRATAFCYQSAPMPDPTLAAPLWAAAAGLMSAMSTQSLFFSIDAASGE